jgi:hypothetical protein
MTTAIWYHRYDLRFRDSGKDEAQGALLKYCFSNGEIGYASLSAWPQAGDRGLAEKLNHLKENPRLEPLWSWASLDAQLRKETRPALPIGSRLPESHWHMRGEDLRSPMRWIKLAAAGHSYWKLKVAPSTVAQLPLLEMAKFAQAHSVKLRLDGNGAFASIAEVEALLSPLAEMNVIDFFEDPSVDAKLWAEIKRVWRVSLAADWYCSRDYSCDLVIHKPTRDAFVPDGMDFAITTAFDHPLGLNYTCYRSLQLKDHPRLRRPLGINHPELYACDGIESEVTFGATGFGWSDLLESLRWQPL